MCSTSKLTKSQESLRSRPRSSTVLPWCIIRTEAESSVEIINVLKTVTFIQNFYLIWYFGIETKCPRERGYVTTKIETLQLQYNLIPCFMTWQLHVLRYITRSQMYLTKPWSLFFCSRQFVSKLIGHFSCFICFSEWNVHLMGKLTNRLETRKIQLVATCQLHK